MLALSTVVVAVLLLSVVPFVLAAYALSRTRYIRLSAWLYIVVSLLIPASMLVIGRFSAEVQPLGAAVYLLPGVLLAGAIGTARAPLVAGILAISIFATAGRVAAVPAWDDQVRQGITFVGLIVFLVIIFNLHRDGIESDRAAELRARNEDLERLRRTLEDRIAERTAALGQRNAEMRLMLDNLSEGVLTADKQGVIASEHSAALAQWFGPPLPGEEFYRYFGRQSTTYGENAEVGW